jgi:glycosyltransferase involved in cell wall biosynthesis
MGVTIPSILVDLERMQYKHTGLYNFCYFLAMEMAQQVDDKQLQLCYYSPQQVIGMFGHNVIYKNQHTLHKIFYSQLNKYNLVHSVHQDSAYFNQKINVPRVLTIHDLNFLYDDRKPSSKKELLLSRLEKKIMSAAHVVAISKFTLAELHKHFDLTNKPTSVIYNGCTINEVTHLVAPVYKPKRKFLFAIGVIMAKKNFHVLPCLLKHNDFELIISGVINDKVYAQEILHAAKKHGVADRVILTDAISNNDKNWYYKSCEAFVFPSISEGFGLPVIEAMYFEKPVLLSRATSLPEVGGNLAYYFDHFEPSHMQDVLARSLSHFNTNNALPTMYKQHALQFNWNQAAKEYLEIYKKYV